MPTDPLDPKGRVDPLGRTTTMTYAALGRITSISDPPGRVTHTIYDTNGRPVSTDPTPSPDEPPAPPLKPDEPPDEPHIVG